MSAPVLVSGGARRRGVRRWPGTGDERRVLAASAISQIGDWCYSVALVVALVEGGAGLGWISASLVVRLAPHALLGALAGVLADRCDRRRLMVVADVGRAGCMLALAVGAGRGPWVLVVLAGLSSTISTVHRPAAVARLVEVVSSDRLATVNGCEGVLVQLAWLAGPALGAGLVAVASPAAAFAANAVTFVVAAVCTLAVRTRSTRPARGPGRRSGWRGELREGIDALTGRASTRAHSALVIAVMGATGVEFVVQVQVAEQRLDAGAGAIGWMVAVVGAGGLVAAPLAIRLAAVRHTGAGLVLSGVLLGVPLVGMGVVRGVVPIGALLALEGAGSVLFEVLAVTALQRMVAGDRLARAVGAQDAAATGAQAIGMVAAPVLVAVVGLGVTLVATGLVLVAVAVMAAPALRGASRSMADVAVAPPGDVPEPAGWVVA
jgi:hypothetical protein